jgi:hypothetical protein
VNLRGSLSTNLLDNVSRFTEFARANSTPATPLSTVSYRDQNGQDWADIIDFLTMYPEAWRRVVRVAR